MSIHERELFIGDSGRGSVVVLLHGTPSNPEDFQPLVDALSRDHRVLVPHLPGYGKTLPDARPSPIHRRIARLEDAIASSGAAGVAIVAFSGGAYQAVAMALAGRVNVHRLALLAPVIGFDPPAAQACRDMIAAVRTGSFDPRPTWLDRMASPGYAKRDPVGAARILSWLDAVAVSGLCDEMVALADAPDLRPRVADLGCPVLVVAGTADHAVPLEASKAVASSGSRSVFVPIEGVGHALLVEAPDRVIQVIADFVDKR